MHPTSNLIEKVYSNEKEFFNFDDINQINHKSNEIIEKKLLKNNEIVNFLNLQSFLIENFEIKSNNKNFMDGISLTKKKGLLYS